MKGLTVDGMEEVDQRPRKTICGVKNICYKKQTNMNNTDHIVRENEVSTFRNAFSP